MKKFFLVGLMGASMATSLTAGAAVTSTQNTVTPEVTANVAQPQITNGKPTTGCKVWQRWSNLTDGEKQAMKNQASAVWQTLTPEEQAKFKQRLLVLKQWSSMTPEAQEQALDEARQAVAKIPPYLRKQLLRQQKIGGNGKQTASTESSRKAWKVLKQLPPSERANIMQ